MYGCGTLWLAFFARNVRAGAPMGLQAALVAGVYPFVVADLSEDAAAAGISPMLWRLVGSG